MSGKRRSRAVRIMRRAKRFDRLIQRTFGYLGAWQMARYAASVAFYKDAP